MSDQDSPQENTEPLLPSSVLLTCWRPEWSASSAAVIAYLKEERFPATAAMLWLAEEGSETLAMLEGHAEDLAFGERPIEILEVQPRPEGIHSQAWVAGLYDLAISRLPASATEVLFVEDDVLAPLGTYENLQRNWRWLPESAAACMVAYESRRRPGYFCAGHPSTGYVKATVPVLGLPQAVPWVGGGYTLYKTEALRACLPLQAEVRGSWVAGWDVTLCERLRAMGWKVFLHREDMALHLYEGR